MQWAKYLVSPENSKVSDESLPEISGLDKYFPETTVVKGIQSFAFWSYNKFSSFRLQGRSLIKCLMKGSVYAVKYVSGFMQCLNVQYVICISVEIREKLVSLALTRIYTFEYLILAAH